MQIRLRKVYQTRSEDPLIVNQVVGVPKGAEIGLSEPLYFVAAYPMGTRPISKCAEPIKV